MIFLYSKWMQLPLSTKALLAKQFGFSKTGATHVSDNRVVQDGYNVNEVESAMDVETIRRYVGDSIADYNVLWQAMIDKVEGKVIETPVDPQTTTPPITVPPSPANAPTALNANDDTPKKKRGRPAKVK